MALDAVINLPANTWTEITQADSTTITIVHRGGADVIIQATTGASPAASDRRGLPLHTSRGGVGDGFLKKTITELSHVALVDRVWAFAVGGEATLYAQADA